MDTHDFTSSTTTYTLLAPSIVLNGAQTTAAVDIGDAREMRALISIYVPITDDWGGGVAWLQDSADNGVNDAWANHTALTNSIGVAGTEVRQIEIVDPKRWIRINYVGAAATNDSVITVLGVTGRDVRR